MGAEGSVGPCLPMATSPRGRTGSRHSRRRGKKGKSRERDELKVFGRVFGAKPPWLPEDDLMIGQDNTVEAMQRAIIDPELNTRTLDVVLIGAPRLWHQSRKSLEFLA